MLECDLDKCEGYLYIYVFISTSCWWAYKIQIELQITCNLYTYIYKQVPHNNTLWSQLWTILIAYRCSWLGHQEIAMQKPMPARQQGSRNPAPDWLVAVPPANQKPDPRILANQQRFMHGTLPKLHSRDIYISQFLNISVHLVSLFIHWMYETCSSEIDWFPLWNVLVSKSGQYEM